MNLPLLKQITDEYVRKTFQQVVDFTRDTDLLQGNLKFFEIVIDRAVTNFQYPHNLGFVPTLLIQGFSSPSTTTVTWKYESFDDTFIVFTTNGAVTLRGYVGSHKTD